MSSSEAELRAEITALLQGSQTLTLATLSAPAAVGGVVEPWAAELFFVNDDDLALYFISSADSRHSRDLLQSPQVAATVSTHVSDWFCAKGLQICGQAAEVPESQRAAVLALYLHKSPQLQAVYLTPANAGEEAIRERLIKSCFFVIRPDWIRLIDNNIQFASKRELRL
ncbi:MAG: hypothetical protein ACI9W6_001535 [Motiliproteus sp.]|jgi:uncharacterized protein YhbP (UPF0306 family)